MTNQHTRAFGTTLRRALALAAATGLIATGLATSALAAGPVEATVVLKADGALLSQDEGRLLAYSYNSARKQWSSVDGAQTDSSGRATVQLEPGEYRFCFESDDILYVQRCYGGVNAWDSTTVNLDSTLDLGEVNLAKKVVADTSKLQIMGRPLVGQRLTFDTSSITPDPEQVMIFWLRDATRPANPGDAPGGEVVGQGPQYVVRNRDLGHTITAGLMFGGPSVRGPELMHDGSFYIHLPAKTIVAPLGFSGAPSIKAPRWKKGAVASYQAPVGIPAGTEAHFQWLRNGRVIVGQTVSTHKLTKADRHKRVSLQVTYTKAGHESVTMESAPSRKVK
ncbi:MAG: hypothetical protein U0R21_03080 [Nocardioidaceae bacterium]